MSLTPSDIERLRQEESPLPEVCWIGGVRMVNGREDIAYSELVNEGKRTKEGVPDEPLR